MTVIVQAVNNFLKLLIIVSFICMTLLPVHADEAEYSKEEKELRIGHLTDFYMTESFVMLRDEELSERITEVIDRIVKVTGKSDSTFYLRIINDPLPVTAAFPGYVYVSSGMLNMLDTKDELAFVISHAISHVIDGDLHQTYIDAVRNDRIANFTGHVMPLLVFSGVGAVGVAGGIAATSASTVGNIMYIGSGISAAATLAQGLADTNVIENKIIHSRLMPHVDLPDKETGFSVFVYLRDVYAGYGEKAEIQADNRAVGYLQQAGYNPDAIAQVLNKIKKNKEGYIADGLVFHLLAAEPGLEKRIDNAQRVLENYK